MHTEEISPESRNKLQKGRDHATMLAVMFAAYLPTSIIIATRRE